MIAESARALVSEARAQRPQETLRTYDRIQAEWRAWCDKKGFDEGTRCVSALLAFIFLTSKGRLLSPAGTPSRAKSSPSS